MQPKGKKVVFGIFDSKSQVERGVETLKSEGFRNSDVSVLMSSMQSSKDFAHEKATKAPEGATTGVATGALLGGTLGWLAGIGTLAIPGIGPFVAAGPIMAALAGAGAGGVLGGVTGALIGLCIPEYEAKRYEGLIKNGGILLSVHVDDVDWKKKAFELLKSCGARDISSTSEVSSSKSSSDSDAVEEFMPRKNEGFRSPERRR